MMNQRSATQSIAMLLLLPAFAALGGCSDGTGPGVFGNAVAITMDGRGLSLEEGEQALITAQARDFRGRVVGCDMSWTSSNPDVVRLLGQVGSIEAVKEGSATITAQCGSTKASVSLSVARAKVITVAVSPEIFELKPGGEITLSAVASSKFIPVLTDRTVSWSSSDPAVATVDAEGRVSIHAAGIAQITANVEDVVGHATAYTFIERASNVTQTDLGTLGGASSHATAINSHGAVVGYSETAQGIRAFLWMQESGMVSLGTLGGSYSAAYDINDAGEVVGESETSTGQRRPFLWTRDGGMRDLAIQSDGKATSINVVGDIVGSRTNGEGFYRGRDGSIRTFAFEPYSINAAGTVVGTMIDWWLCYYYYGVECLGTAHRWSVTGGLSTIFQEPGTATDINDRDEVVGRVASHGPYRLSAAKGRELLVTFGPNSDGSASAINAFSEVAGSARTHIDHAVLWTASGARVILSDLESAATAVNDGGWVVGWRVGSATDGIGRRATLWRVSGLPRP